LHLQATLADGCYELNCTLLNKDCTTLVSLVEHLTGEQDVVSVKLTTPVNVADDADAGAHGSVEDTMAGGTAPPLGLGVNTNTYFETPVDELNCIHVGTDRAAAEVNS
jgi:hypothetical protein